MIEETATVVDATDDYIWVEAKTRSACSTCGSQSGCSTSSLSKLFGIRQQNIRLPNTFGSRIGEQVVIGVEDQVMVTASLAAYILPIVLMLAAAIAADSAGLNDRQAAASALVGLFAGLLGAGILTGSYRMRRYFQPQLLRRITPHPLTPSPSWGEGEQEYFILAPLPLRERGWGEGYKPNSNLSKEKDHERNQHPDCR